ncbi:FAD dependent oxidoreductase [Kribbella voronezhensis]|uniref:FAD dependent oxidoreductase n=1 Tax=Kribbella voronezhensis TaxID=2512212 RepID=A0A4R7T7E0_9ACTN|nr:FAD-dependent oxidoreductase [Kribbella voronezhensis]TDU87196.1 FAD dependent oxidoreductase [Kribbella voronezhensis]
MTTTVDVCVYGGTAAGCVAAMTAHQEGASVVLIEPGSRLGGMLGAGIKPRQDCPIPAAVGGLTSDVVFGFGDHPHEVMRAFHRWIASTDIEVIFERRVRSVTREGNRIASIRLETSQPDRWGVPLPASESVPDGEVRAAVFIDASYEGDLMARADVPYRIGRESQDAFGEELAGVRPVTNWTPIDPYVVPGDSTSGLLPLLDPDHGLPVGAGDSYTQAYNYRFYVTTDPARRALLTPPDDYSPDQYELVRRYVAHLSNDLEALRGIFPGWINSGEYNYQRSSLITNAPLGVSREYQDGTWDDRSRIWRGHLDYLRGLHHFLSTDPSVLEEFRAETAAYGLDASVFPETDGWPPQLYVRATRRLEGRYTVTHADVINQTDPGDGIGLALFGVDVYPVRRIPYRDPATGELGVATEGDMFIGGHLGTGEPYPVPYRAVVPRQADCGNLLVPVCLSASHIGYAATRMEPVFCVLAESAAVAAVQALRAQTDVQAVDITKLQSRIVERGQVIAWESEESVSPRLPE